VVYELGEVARPARPIVDIMDVLRKSLEMVRKPPASEKAEIPAKAAKNRRSRR
jgi:non-homologous end joining protein Ku